MVDLCDDRRWSQLEFVDSLVFKSVGVRFLSMTTVIRLKIIFIQEQISKIFSFYDKLGTAAKTSIIFTKIYFLET